VQVGLQAIADRWTYMSLTGVAIIIAWSAAEFIKTRKVKIAATILSVLIIAVLATLQYRQTGYWRNSETLYSHAIKAVNGNYWAYDFLGETYIKQGRYQEAVDCLQKSLQISADNAEAKCLLGKALLGMGKPDEAVLVFESFLPTLPVNTQQADFGNVTAEPSQLGAIVQIYTDSHLDCAVAFLQKGDYDNAIKHFKEVLRVNPRMVSVHQALCEIYLEKGDPQKAANQYGYLLKFDPQEMETLSRICYKLNEQGKAVQVEIFIRKIIEIIPRSYPKTSIIR
jgi:tetratricopeptide (TPR) repeat protein